MDLKSSRMSEFGLFLLKIWPPGGHKKVLNSSVPNPFEWIFYIMSILSAKRSLGPKMHFFEKHPGGTFSWPSIKKLPDSTLIWYMFGQFLTLLLKKKYLVTWYKMHCVTSSKFEFLYDRLVK